MGNRLKKNDTVVVISGKDKGKKGKIIGISSEGIIVEKVNVAHKHQRPTKTFQGGIIEKPMEIDSSKVMPVCHKCNEAVRIGFSEIEGKSVRKCSNCEEIIDKVK